MEHSKFYFVARQSPIQYIMKCEFGGREEISNKKLPGTLSMLISFTAANCK